MILISYTEKDEDRVLQERNKKFECGKEATEFLRSLKNRLGSRLVGKPLMEEIISS